MIHKISLIIIMALIVCSCSNNYSLCLVFDNVEGLQTDSGVTLNGVEIGEIEHMSAFAQGVYVNVSIDEEYKIPKNSSFSMMQPGFLGEKFIDVKFSAEKQFLKNNDTVKVISPRSDLNPALQKLSVNEIDTLVHRWAREMKVMSRQDNQ